MALLMLQGGEEGESRGDLWGMDATLRLYLPGGTCSAPGHAAAWKMCCILSLKCSPLTSFPLAWGWGCR